MTPDEKQKLATVLLYTEMKLKGLAGLYRLIGSMGAARTETVISEEIEGVGLILQDLAEQCAAAQKLLDPQRDR
jgi:hypothetical protein